MLSERIPTLGGRNTLIVVSAVICGLSWTFFNKSEPIDEMSIIARIAQNSLKRPLDGSQTTFSELWKEHRCVFVFFRRWG